MGEAQEQSEPSHHHFYIFDGECCNIIVNAVIYFVSFAPFDVLIEMSNG